MRVRVKICGVTDLAGIEAATDAGADALGLVFFPRSSRYVSPERAVVLARAMPPLISRVAVFFHPTSADIHRVHERVAVDWVQAEPAPEIHTGAPWRLLPVLHDGPALPETLRALDGGADSETARPVYLLDSAGRGGLGVLADWTRAAEIARERRIILAGGLDSDNVAHAIARVRPYGVDVSSGVESSPGRKDPTRIRAFLAAVRNAERLL